MPARPQLQHWRNHLPSQAGNCCEVGGGDIPSTACSSIPRLHAKIYPAEGVFAADQCCSTHSLARAWRHKWEKVLAEPSFRMIVALHIPDKAAWWKRNVGQL